MIDIVVTTCDRLPYLRKTLAYIVERTITSYRLTVIDDASTDGTVEYLKDPRNHWMMSQYRLNPTSGGPVDYLKHMLRLTASDPIVVTDDDVLCPKLEPDWLAQGLKALKDHPELAVIALNNPACNVRKSRKIQSRGPQVTTCTILGGTFLFIRRRALEGYVPSETSRLGPIKTWLRTLSEPRGYLTNVYCQHIGMQSVRTEDTYKGVIPMNLDTLEPIAKYRG